MNTKFDPDKQSTVIIDGSKFAVCGILLQDNNIVACTSRTLNKHQRNWAPVEIEQFALEHLQKVLHLPNWSPFHCSN